MRRLLVGSACVLGFGAGCGDCNAPPGQTYYERNIQPILTQKCSGNTSGCHKTNVGDPYQFAAGNFNVSPTVDASGNTLVSSFDNVQKRRDVLTRFGAYPQPLLLVKGIAPEEPDPTMPNRLQFQYGLDLVTDPTGNTPAFRDIEVLHAGGAILELNSDAYLALQTWLENGATEDGLKPPTPAQTGNGTCSTALPSGFTTTTFQMNPSYAAGLAKFKSDVQPILDKHGCTSSNCHGAPQSDFYITCGTDPASLAFNFTQAWSFVNTPVDDSEILRVPLAVAAGGRGHTGGDQFSGTADADYVAIRGWASSIGVLNFANGDRVKQYFMDNVQPILIARGCSFQACHSPQSFNDFKLRSGTQGFFSPLALEKNYELLKDNFMAMEFPDARRGRAIAKTVLTDDFRLTTVGGIEHRGGPVLETPGFAADPAGSVDPTAPTPACTVPPADATPFCIIQAWVGMERAAMAANVTSMNQNDTVPLVYVDRPAGQVASRLEFDTFQPGADLRVVTAKFGADFGQQLSVDNATQASLLANCRGHQSRHRSPRRQERRRHRGVRGARVGRDGLADLHRQHRDPGLLAGRHRRHRRDRRLRSGVVARRHVPRVRVDARQVRPDRDPLSRKRFLPQSDIWRLTVATGIADRHTRADDRVVELRDQPAVHARGPDDDVDREGERRLLPGLRPPHELGPHRLPPAARAARARRTTPTS